jgi:hypothetical protein
MTLYIKNSGSWLSSPSLSIRSNAYWTYPRECYIKNAGTWTPFNRTSGPTLRALGGTFATNSSNTTGPLTISIPNTAVVGDYLVIASTNVGGPTEITVGGTSWYSFYGLTSSGATYGETIRFSIKICTATDIGRTYYLSNGGFSMQAMVYVFTNPNKIGSNATNLTAQLTASTSTISGNSSGISGLTFAKTFNYECLLIGLAANGSSGYPNQGYSGQGSFRTITDSYWWRSIGLAYIENNNAGNPTSSFTASNPSALSYAAVRLL